MSAASASRIGVVAQNTQGLKMRAQSRSLGAASRRSATSASRNEGKGHRGDVAMRSTERPGEGSGATAEASSSMDAPAEYPSTARTRAIRNDEFAIPSMPPAQMEEKFLTATAAERAHWFPVAFANGLDEATMVPFDLFNVPWVMFRDGDGAAGCVKDECAHRACPLSLGKLVDGRAQCPYHGWEYTTGGECVKMPSIKKMLPGVYVDAAPVVERDGFLYLWAGKWEPGVEDEVLAKVPRRSLAPPEGFTPMAEVTVDIPMEAEEVLSRLMAPGGADLEDRDGELRRGGREADQRRGVPEDRGECPARFAQARAAVRDVPPRVRAGLHGWAGGWPRGLERAPDARGAPREAGAV